MIPTKLNSFLVAVAILSLAPGARGQQRAPRLGYVVPAGGKQGTTFRVTIGGRFLSGASGVIVSGEGVEATVIEHNKPMSGTQFQLLRDELKKLMARKLAAQRPVLSAWRNRKNSKGKAGKKVRPASAAPSKKTVSPAKASATGKADKPPAKPAWSDADEKKLAEVRYKLRNAPNRKIAPALIETVFVEVKVAPNALPGKRELRMVTRLGLTNPMVFFVGQLPELNEASPISTGQMTSFRGAKAPVDTDTEITLPAVVNGQIMPGDVDRFKFKARKGQRLVVSAAARELIPYLADAVPGWFQATLSLRDSKGRELIFADRHRFHQDPVLYYEIQKDDEYVVEIRDSIYRGREDFIYRVSLGQLPLVTNIFPLGGRAGGRAAIELTGWNLPVGSIVWNTRNCPPGVYPVSVGVPPRVSNCLSFAVDDLPECLERAGNDRTKTAQKVTLPVIVNGRIDRPGDSDVFSFHGVAGSEFVAEVVARRLDSPLDSMLTLTDSAGRQIACNDDTVDRGAGLDTHHADSFIRASLPVDGMYYVHLGDTQKKGGREYAYRLRMGPPRPDFELRVVPSSINMRPGASVPLTVYAIRRDGFDGQIQLSTKPGSDSFKLGGATIPAGQDKVRMTLTAPPTALKQPVNLAMAGEARINGRRVVHRVVPAEDMMQAFLWRQLVPAENMTVNVTGRWTVRSPVTLVGETPVKIPVGGTARMRLKLPARGRAGLAGQVQLELDAPPEGITIQKVFLGGKDPSIVLKSDPEKTKSGLKGNLIVNAYLSRSVPASKGSTKKVKRRFLVSALPAMPFEIVVGSR